jgi:hypothetical protein
MAKARCIRAQKEVSRLRGEHPPLLGLALSVGHAHLSPFFYYLLALHPWCSVEHAVLCYSPSSQLLKAHLTVG